MSERGDTTHGDPGWRRVGRGAAQAFRPAEDVREITESAARIQRPITTGRRIAVTGIRGGAGKSTVTALLATVFAHHRRDRVLALDIDPDLGTLVPRLGIRARRSLAELPDEAEAARTFAGVEPFLLRGGERLWALSGHRAGIGDSRLDAAAYGATAVPLTRFFGVTLIDCGPGVEGELIQAVLGGAHAQVLVTPATPDGARSAGRALDLLAGNGFGHLLARTVVVFTAKGPHSGESLDAGRAAAILNEVGAATITLRYDRHIAAASVLAPQRFAHTTRVAALGIAAEALDRAR
ncbi:MinD/ParA family ATP-binding protein [Spirillospora sp. NBC_01491]|uniref:MinD/ParA family ATP-binding protein n=1 Tax=Spirillospora sp. NBC_01491 TaxID=2976007 RepID=UPI002E306A39|nr:cellulose synthase operon protein YhjQ/BcsQ [Spirillospora sp. NBC_01491]